MNGHVTEDLGLYAAGLLEPTDRRAAERHIDACADCRAAVALEEDVAWALAEAAARPAPAALRSRILDAHRPRWWSWPLPRIGFAAAAALVIVLGAALAQTSADLQHERALRDGYARALGALAADGRVVPLQASAGISGRASLIVSGSGEAHLVLLLPPAPAGKTYEAWVIRDGDPVPAGLASARDGVVIVQLSVSARPGDVAAITVEAAGGVAKPTTDPILVGKL